MERIGFQKEGKLVVTKIKRKTFYIGLPLLDGYLVFEISPTKLRVGY